MRSFISKCFSDTGPLWLVAVVFLVISGCATTAPRDTGQELTRPDGSEAARPAVSEQKETAGIEAINIVGEGDSVLIQANRTVQYTAFMLTDPARLVIDMPDVDISKVMEPISVDNRYLKEISASVYGGKEKISRIVLELHEGIDHEVRSGENSILISLKEDPFSTDIADASKDSPVVVASVGEVADVGVVAPPEQGSSGEAGNAVDAQEEPAEPLTPASTIENLDASDKDGNTVVRIEADGEIGNYNTFELDNPSRIVVDIWGVTNSTGMDILRVNDRFIKSVRIGKHSDKLRFVFDAAGEEIPPYVITKTGNYIVASFNPIAGTDAQDNASQITEETSSAAAPEEPAQVADEVTDGGGQQQLDEKVTAEGDGGSAGVDVSAEAVTAPEAEAVAVAEEVPTEKNEVVDLVNGSETAPEDVAPEEAVQEVAAPEDVAPEEAVQEETAPEEAVQEAAPAPQQEEETVQASNDVRNIEYKKTGDKGYLTIETSEKPQYAVKESTDGKTLVIDINDAAISQGLTRTLDATKLATPVATISSYQRSTRPGAVRIFVELTEKAQHNIKEFNNTLTVVFSPPAEAPPAEAGQAKSAGALSGRKYTGQKIDLDMMDANITDILRLLAEVSDLNIIASDDVKGTISLRLKNVPWDQAFDIVLKSKGLDKIKEGNVVRVAPASKISQERESVLAAKKAHEKLEPMSIKFMSVNYAKASELVEQVKTVLTDRGSVTSEKRTNTLVIRDTKRGIDSAVNLVTKLDTPIPQVLIEARIVEASTSFARDLGIQWGVDYQTGGNVSTDTFGSTTSTGQSVSSSTTAPTFSAQDGANNFAVNLPASGTAGTLGALGFILGKAGQNPLVLDLRLSAGEQEGSVRTISRPRVVSMDNKEAKIEQGESIPFETTSSTGTSTTFVDANLSLTVTPHITPDGSIIMNIKASRNSIGTFRTSSGEPSIDKKESSTEVLVKDGETTVIGGIVVSDKSETDSGIPYLRKIPIFGWLFKSKSISDSQKELLIFITPTIIKNKVVS